MAHDERALRLARDAALSGVPARATGRSVIEASWARMRTGGLDPAAPPEVAPLDGVELEARRSRSGLALLVPRLRAALAPALDLGDLLMVVADTDGRVLWREGRPGVRRLADRLGFVGGSAWTEGNVGTNAIGTCLVLGAPVHIAGAEHYVESHTRWSCAAAPVLDPWSGRALGVVDVSGPAGAVDSRAVALVALAARVATLEVRAEQSARLDVLRAHAAPLVARVGGRALVVDEHGRTAAVTGLRAPDQVALPAGMAAGEVWLPRLGPAVAEPLPGGWLLRLDPDPSAALDAEPPTLTLDLTAGTPTLAVRGPAGTWQGALSPRHTEILVALLAHPAGRTAAELATDLYADPTRVVTVRAEVSRLRRVLGPLLAREPYRVVPSVVAELLLPADRSALLPGSSAPVLASLRRTTPA